MVANATSGNVFPIEDNLRGYCGMLDNYCTIFAVYDMCKSERAGYQKLTMKAEKPGAASGPSRGDGDETVLHKKFW